MGVTNTKYIKAGNFFAIAITTDCSGRASIVVHENPHLHNKTIIDIELPCKRGEFKDAFKPSVKVTKEIEIEQLKE
jgi:hypothetical protein